MTIKRQVWLRSCALISNQPFENKMQLHIKRIVYRCPLKTIATFLATKSKLKLTGVVETLRIKAAPRCSLLLQRQSKPSKTIIVMDRKEQVLNLPLALHLQLKIKPKSPLRQRKLRPTFSNILTKTSNLISSICLMTAMTSLTQNLSRVWSKNQSFSNDWSAYRQQKQ